jgi:integrase
MWTQEGVAKAHLYRAVRQGTDWHPAGDEADRARVEALAVPEEVHITRFLAPYKQPTRGKYQAILFEWLTWCLRAGVRMLEADRTLIEEWSRTLRKTVSKGTVGSKLVPVCGFYRWAYEEELIRRDPSRHVRRPARPRRSNLRYLEADQAERALAASLEAGPPVSGLVHLLLLNGPRITETLEARIEHLGRQGELTTLLMPHRKGGVMDRISLPVETVAALEGCIGGREKGYLLGRKRLQPAQVYRYFDALSDVVGLDFRLRPHMLRATFVTLALDAGIPARDIIASAGWVSREMLEYYDRGHASIVRNASHRVAAHIRENHNET